MKDHNITSNQYILNIVEIALYLTLRNESYIDDSSTNSATEWLTFRFILKNLDAKAVFQSKKLHLYAKINQAESGQSNLLEF